MTAGGSLVLRTADTAETLALGQALAEAALDTGVDALVLDLHGHLGAGKTVFMRGLARGLGVTEGVVSPTFTIARSYALSGVGFEALHHIDAYRLTSAEELDAAGFEDMWGTGRVTGVEWGEHVEDALPMDRIRVALQSPPAEAPPAFDDPEAAREIRLTATGPSAARVLDALRNALDTLESTR